MYQAVEDIAQVWPVGIPKGFGSFCHDPQDYSKLLLYL